MIWWVICLSLSLAANFVLCSLLFNARDMLRLWKQMYRDIFNRTYGEEPPTYMLEKKK